MRPLPRTPPNNPPCRHQQFLNQRRSDARRALLVGGRFLLHGEDGKACPVLLWLDQQSSCLCVAGQPADAGGWGLLPRLRRAGLARSRSHTHLASGGESTTAFTARGSVAAGRGDGDGLAVAAWGMLCTASKSELSLLHRIQMSAVAGLRGGAEPFAGGVDGFTSGGGLNAAANPDLCLAILCGGATAGVPPSTVLELQVPPDSGNGRSRDEWLAALRDAWQDYRM